MSCAWCAYFKRPEKYYDLPEYRTRYDYASMPGKCTRDPVWLDVAGEHVCGSFTWEKMGLGDNKTTPIAQNWRAAGDLRVANNELRAELKRLREANKQLRAKAKQRLTEKPETV